MKTIVRIYQIEKKTGNEIGIMDPDKIVEILSKPEEDVDLDYTDGGTVKMGSSKELVGEHVTVGEMDIMIPEH